MAADVVFPPSLPPAGQAGHQLTPLDIARRSPRDRGEARVRHLFRTAPERCAIYWWLTQSQLDTFHDWFETELQAGARRFDVLIADQGSESTSWWTAIFVEPYQWEIILEAPVYRVTATLTLFGPPTTDRIAPGINASGTNARTGGATMPAGVLRASGTNLRGGGWFLPASNFLASGTNARSGGWFTGLAPGGGGGDELAQAWLFRSRLPEAFDDEDAQALAHLTF